MFIYHFNSPHKLFDLTIENFLPFTFWYSFNFIDSSITFVPLQQWALWTHHKRFHRFHKRRGICFASSAISSPLCLFMLRQCFFFLLLLHHDAALSTSSSPPPPTVPPTQSTYCCLCSSCDCYFLSTCAKLNNKSFGLKRKQNQSERKIAKATILTKIKKRKGIENPCKTFAHSDAMRKRMMIVFHCKDIWA